MSASIPSTTTDAVAAAPTASVLAQGQDRTRSRLLLAHYLALGAVLALSATLNVVRLAQNGYANSFYSAGVKSMLGSLHNFLFVSFDPGGLITVDKPPLGLWLQVASAKLFGFSPLSLLLPEAIAGVLAVAALYWTMSRSFGRTAALIGALALAVFPSFVAVARDNNMDALLILLMVLSCGLALRAIESGRWRTLLGCAVVVGLAFNTKTLAAYMIVPGITLAYLLGAPGSISRRLLALLAAGGVMAVVSFSWIAFVELTPASQRPFVGGSVDNTEFGLTFDYNGFGRVGGQVGGPGRIPIVIPHHTGRPKRVHHTRSRVHLRRRRGHAVSSRARHVAHTRRSVARARRAAAARTRHAKSVVGTASRSAPKQARRAPSPTLSNGRERHPTAFGGPTGPLRLIGTGLGDQGGWMLPFALLGLLAVALGLGRSRTPVDPGQDPAQHAGQTLPTTGRRDPRLAGVLVLGGWFVVEAAVLSFSKGIVHPYYVSALGPGVAAMVGAGLMAFAGFASRRDPRIVLAPLAVGATVVVQLTLLRRVHYMSWFEPLLVAGAVLGVLGLLSRRLQSIAGTVLLGTLLLAPAVYAATTWQAPVQGTFPAAGPRQAVGFGGLGVSPASMPANRAMLTYVKSHRPGRRWALLTDASDTASPLILLGLNAGAVGGYSGVDPALDGRGLAALVKRGEARYVVLGGAYASRGGNHATAAVARACQRVPEHIWLPGHSGEGYLILFDCAGRERELRAA